MKVACETLYLQAVEAGMVAGRGASPTPMVVQEHKHVLDDHSPVVKSYYVPDGVCGYASITIKPSNSKFAKWLVQKGLAKKSTYEPGVHVWVREFGQSYGRKRAYANAFADVLVLAGVAARSESRID